LQSKELFEITEKYKYFLEALVLFVDKKFISSERSGVASLKIVSFGESVFDRVP
jgi:hypothetical protein